MISYGYTEGVMMLARIEKLDDLKAQQKWLLVLLCSYANKDGDCWPSQKKLAKISNMTPKTVRANLKALEEKGYITSQQQVNPKGDLSTNLYTVNIEPAKKRTPKVVPIGKAKHKTTEEKLTDTSWAESSN